jgi:hypothetical protein
VDATDGACCAIEQETKKANTAEISQKRIVSMNPLACHRDQLPDQKYYINGDCDERPPILRIVQGGNRAPHQGTK